jgi:hypothetical protein
VMEPPLWEAIETARRRAAGSPGAWDAQVLLARALVKGLPFKYGLIEIGSSQALAEEADAAFQRALELAPNNPDIYAEYLSFLVARRQPADPAPLEEIKQLLARGLSVAPKDSRLLEIQKQVTWIEEYLTSIPPTETPVPTSTETSTPSLTPSPVPPSATPPPPPTETPSPSPTPAAEPRFPLSCCAAPAAAVLAPLAALRRRGRRKESC